MDEEIEKAKAKLIELQNSGDIENAHQVADNIICNILMSLGYSDIVIEFNKLEKWYA